MLVGEERRVFWRWAVIRFALACSFSMELLIGLFEYRVQSRFLFPFFVVVAIGVIVVLILLMGIGEMNPTDDKDEVLFIGISDK